MRYFEDFRIGDVFELGRRRLTEDEMVSFARQYDPQPQHVERSADRPIASGWQVAATFMRMYVDSVGRESATDVSPGVEELRWLRPVRPGDVLVARMTVVGTSLSLTRPDCGILRQLGELFDDSAAPTMRLMFYVLLRKRPCGSVPP